MLGGYHALLSVLTAALLPAALGAKTHSASPGLAEQTLETIQECMAQSPASWPEQWKRKYIETIRRAIEHNRDAPHYAERLEILRKGFARCWESVPKTKGKNDRSLFEVYRCRMRWYVEHLMKTQFPTMEERQKVRDQFADMWDHAAESLLAEFAFLDPNAVQKAKAEDLSACYRKIDAPLMPVYMRPMSREQVDQIKKLGGNSGRAWAGGAARARGRGISHRRMD
jgi:hypothetical protein